MIYWKEYKNQKQKQNKLNLHNIFAKDIIDYQIIYQK